MDIVGSSEQQGQNCVHTLSLSGNAFRVWQSANPGMTNAPLLVSGQTVTNGVNGVSWGMNHTANVYVQAVTNGTATLTYSYTGSGSASGIVCRTTMKMTAWNFALVPDFNRDGEIGANDRTNALANVVFPIWINDDDDVGATSQDGGTDIPGQEEDQDCADTTVTGERDRLDLFPLLLDIGGLEQVLGTADSYRLVQTDAAVNFAYTSLTPATAGLCQTSWQGDAGPWMTGTNGPTVMHPVADSGTSLDTVFVNWMRQHSGQGVVLIEGRTNSAAPLVLEAVKNGAVLATVELAMLVAPVEQMYHELRLRDGASYLLGGNATPLVPVQSGEVLFVHGFNVTEEEGLGWGAEIFKRLWQSGNSMPYTSVTWDGDIGWPNAFFYQDNVYSAFQTAQRLATYVNANLAISTNVVLIAHSLGNMVVASAIEDCGMNVHRFIMLNAAVPAETFDPSQWNTNATGNVMVPDDWQGYANRTWASMWHKLFNAPDDRAGLLWSNCFTNIPASALYNYHSTGDEVLELFTAAPSTLEGIDPLDSTTRGRYAWHKQETHKGVSWYSPSGTSWAGWGFSGSYDDESEANAATTNQLQCTPVFRDEPSGMFTNAIPADLQNGILARGIPALSGPVGSRFITFPPTTGDRNFNMNDAAYRLRGWPRNHQYFQQRWLHSDIKDIAHFYISTLFEDIVGKGGLK